MGEVPFIQVKNLTKRFGKNLVLDNITVDIPYGKIFGILGQSGCGKTTLLNLIVGFYKPTKGVIYFQGKDIFKDIHDVEKRFGFSTQGLSFYPKLTVIENLYYFGKMYNLEKKEIKERTEEILKLVDLSKAKNTVSDKLSSGMQKRLDIACSLIHEPEILILDEPTQDLDPILRKDVLALIKKINEKGTTVIITSHLLGEIDYLCENIAILNKGKILKMKSLAEIESDYSKNKIINIETIAHNYENYLKILRKNKDIDDISTEGKRLIIRTPKADSVMPFVLNLVKKNKDKIVSLHFTKPSLEEIFEKVIKEDK